MNSDTELEIVNEIPQELRLTFASDYPDLDEILATRRKLLKKVADFDAVESVDDTPHMDDAKRLRLDLVKCRTGMDRIRKDAGEASRRRTNSINDMFRGLISENQSAEDFLEESEKFAERYEQSRKAEIREQRLALWRAEGFLETLLSGIDAGELTEAQWNVFWRTGTEDKKARQEADENERQQQEADRAERQRLAAENTRLQEERRWEQAATEEQRRKDGEALRAMQEKALKEKQAAEAKLAEERRQREALERAEQQRKDAEAAAAKTEADAKRKAGRAPDKQKLIVFLDGIRAILQSQPKVKDEAELILDTLLSKLQKVLTEAQQQVEKL